MDNAPTPRAWHAAVWANGRMVIAGGYDGSNMQGDVASYDPSTDRWSKWFSVGPIAESLW